MTQIKNAQKTQKTRKNTKIAKNTTQIWFFYKIENR